MISHKGRPFVCFNCGYALRACVKAHCPECGWLIAPPPGGRLARKRRRLEV